jgi:hypothetical protein
VRTKQLDEYLVQFENFSFTLPLQRGVSAFAVLNRAKSHGGTKKDDQSEPAPTVEVCCKSHFHVREAD